MVYEGFKTLVDASPFSVTETTIRGYDQGGHPFKKMMIQDFDFKLVRSTKGYNQVASY